MQVLVKIDIEDILIIKTGNHVELSFYEGN